MQYRKILYTLLFGLVGGALFFLLRLPLPWILGPALAVMVMNAVRPGLAQIPGWLSDIGIIVIAYMLARTLSPETGQRIILELPWMIVAALLWILVCFVIGLLFAKVARLDEASSVLGCMPGGLSQMVLMAEDVRGADPGTVALIQTIRLIVVLYTVPFLGTVFAGTSAGAGETVAGFAAEGTEGWPALYGYVLLPFVLVAAWALRRLKVPVGEFVGPALFTGILAALGCTWPEVPNALLAAAQLVVGLRIGIRVKPRMIWTNKRLAPLAFASGALLVLIAAFASWLLAVTTSDTIVTWFLAIAPGGLAEVAATAIVLGADVTQVTAYQMARLFMILLFAPPLLRWLLTLHRGWSSRHRSA